MKKIFLIGGGLLLILILLPLALFPQRKFPNPLERLYPTPTPIPAGVVKPEQKPIEIVSASPNDGAKDVPVSTPIVVIFNRPVKESGVYFSLAPHTEYTLSIEGNLLIATPTAALLPATTYSYIVYPLANEAQATLRTFSTPGTTSQTPIETRPYHISEDYDAYLQQNNLDIFLANNTPYETSSFSINSGFDSSKGHFSFQVTSYTESGKQDFLSWVHSLGLTDQQINKLYILFQ